MRRTPPVTRKNDVPAWFMTYSDVITLLMTFFILLLTFATNEPEMFERLQMSLFGGSGSATGIAGTIDDQAERDSWLLRERPPSSRLTMEGSEMPPIHSDPAQRSVKRGLAGLDDEAERDPTITHQIDIPLSLLASDSEPYSLGAQLARMLGRQLQRKPFHVKLLVSDDRDLAAVMVVAQMLVHQQHVMPGKIAIGLEAGTGIPADHARLVTYWHQAEDRS